MLESACDDQSAAGDPDPGLRRRLLQGQLRPSRPLRRRGALRARGPLVGGGAAWAGGPARITSLARCSATRRPSASRSRTAGSGRYPGRESTSGCRSRSLRLPPSSGSSRCGRRGRQRSPTSCSCRQRGYFALGGLNVTSGDVFGLRSPGIRAGRGVVPDRLPADRLARRAWAALQVAVRTSPRAGAALRGPVAGGRRARLPERRLSPEDQLEDLGGDRPASGSEARARDDASDRRAPQPRARRVRAAGRLLRDRAGHRRRGEHRQPPRRTPARGRPRDERSGPAWREPAPASPSGKAGAT